jgi:hypothetical protein
LITQNSGPNGQPEAQLELGLELLPAPGVHADLAASPSLPSPDKQGAAALIQIGLARMTATISSTFGGSGGIAQALVARPSTGVEAGHRCRRSASTSAVEQ